MGGGPGVVGSDGGGGVGMVGTDGGEVFIVPL